MKTLLSLLIFLIFSGGSVAYAGSPPLMDKDELKALLGKENLVILDVRQGSEWSASKFKIKDAVRVENGDLSVAGNYPRDHTFVLYCA